jgi:hypothetical protein
MANRTSHRYNRLPLLPSGPGGVQQELVVPICRVKGSGTGPKLQTYFGFAIIKAPMCTD